MEFCSKFGYNYGFDGSDEEDIEEEDKITKQKVLKKFRKADTNIISLKLNKLIEATETIACKPIECKNCGAIMSHLSGKNIKKENDLTTWTCEFCSESNNIMENYHQKVPKSDEPTYVIEQVIKKEINQTDTSSDVISYDDNYFTFCIDISGSMRTNIDSSILNNSIFGAPSKIRNSVSRLDAVKSACVDNFKKLKKEEPNKKVVLVTFSSIINYYGDCTKLNDSMPLISIKENSNSLFNSFQLNSTNHFNFSNHRATRPLMITVYENDVEMTDIDSNAKIETLEILLKKNNILSSKEDILKIAELTDENIIGISQSFTKLEEFLKHLEPTDSTALGPALVYSIGLSKKAGSQICLLTDGAANIGIGAGSGSSSEEFYDEMASYARSKGITINVVTVKGTDCRLAVLGKLADITNGNLNIVNPLNLSDELKFILNDRIKATNVKVKLIANHKYIYLRGDDLQTAEGKAIETNDNEAMKKLNHLKKSIIIKELGAAKNDSEIIFEYGIKKINNIEDKTSIDELPFQIQIEFTSIDGVKSLRVYTKTQKFTNDRNTAETNINSANLIFSCTIQKAAKQVLNNNIGMSLNMNQATTSMANRLCLQQSSMFGVCASTLSSLDRNLQFRKMDDITANKIYGFAKPSTYDFLE